jgi:hypothetical protein
VNYGPSCDNPQRWNVTVINSITCR